MSLTPTVDPGTPVPAYAGSIVRWALTMAAAWLVKQGVTTDAMTPELIGGGMAAATILWSIVQKYLAHQKLTVATGG